MIVKFEKLFNSKEELQTQNKTNPFNVAGLFINILNSYDINNDEKFIDLLQFLMGDFQQISPLMRQNIKDRMTQNEKYKFIGKSYFKGAIPENDYTPSIPYEIDINEYSKVGENMVKLWIKSGGADNPRDITVRLAKDRNYYIWSDSFMGLLTDIRNPESTNPWTLK